MANQQNTTLSVQLVNVPHLHHYIPEQNKTNTNTSIKHYTPVQKTSKQIQKNPPKKKLTNKSAKSTKNSAKCLRSAGKGGRALVGSTWHDRWDYEPPLVFALAPPGALPRRRLPWRQLQLLCAKLLV